MDEVELYHRVLTQNEVLFLFTAGATGKCKPVCDPFRLIAHITDPNGSFTTRTLITNATTSTQNYELYAFDTFGAGSPSGAVSGSIAAQSTDTQTTLALFGNTDVSHFFIKGSDDADFLAEYVAASGGNPAHVAETTSQAKVWPGGSRRLEPCFRRFGHCQRLTGRHHGFHKSTGCRRRFP